MSYGWRITEVNEEFLEKDEIGICGPSDISAEHEKELIAGYGTDFEMFDDDNEHYYSGRIVGEFDGNEPLFDFGLPNAGCTLIKLINEGGEFVVV